MNGKNTELEASMPTGLDAMSEATIIGETPMPQFMFPAESVYLIVAQLT
jgi:hypothetical protein